MKAVRQYEFGDPNVLRLEDVPDPHPAAGQVRICVATAGVHLLDTVIRRGRATARIAPVLPLTPGREVAGVVDEVGRDIDTAVLGRQVVADLGLASGGYAEYAVADANGIHLSPDGLAADVAVAMIGTGRTAMAILELAAIGPGDTVVITAAAGGIGSLLVQAARRSDAAVLALAGGDQKIKLARDLGADYAVDYLQAGWPDRARKLLFDSAASLALDGVGGEVGRAALELLGPGGRLVMFGSASGTLTDLSSGDLFARGISATSAVGARILRRPGGTRDLEKRALGAAATGELVPMIGGRYPISDAAAAHAALESRETVGKVILYT